MPTFTLHQTTSFDSPLFTVTNSVAEASVYVYTTVTQAFSHYATAADMIIYPTELAIAQLTNAKFYRLPSVTRTWETLVEVNDDLATSIRRLQSLAEELVQVGALVTLDRITIVRA